MVCPESANFFYGEYGEYGVSRESMSNPGKSGFSFCFSIQVPLLSYRALRLLRILRFSSRREIFSYPTPLTRYANPENFSVFFRFRLTNEIELLY